ncbi:hypothetical protein ACFYOT_37975 [Saccharothrix saharensis]|uniref:hypothetical protein n=1 Tax=Saccharothrix saharensis TaxID=571190 RepID=UPI0036955E32
MSRRRDGSTGAVDSHYRLGLGFGVTVEPGQAVEGTLRAILNSRVDLLTLDATARSGQPDADPADNTATAAVPIPYVLGTIKGTVYADHNGNAAARRGARLGQAVRVPRLALGQLLALVRRFGLVVPVDLPGSGR